VIHLVFSVIPASGRRGSIRTEEEMDSRHKHAGMTKEETGMTEVGAHGHRFRSSFPQVVEPAS